MTGIRGGRDLVDLSARLLHCVEEGNEAEALRLVRERGLLIDRLLRDPGALQPAESLIRRAHDLGRQALEAARARSAEILTSLESLDHGRTGLSAYHPRPPVEGDTLDVRR